MATVVISKDLILHVENQIRQLHAQAVTDARKVPSHWGDLVVSKLIPAGTRELMAKLPNRYFYPMSKIVVHPVPGHAVTYGFTGELSSPVLAPVYFTAEHHGLYSDTHYNTAFRLNPDDPRWNTFLNGEYAEWCRNIRDVEFKRDNDIVSARSLLCAFRTLGPALKEWPALWELLPDSTKAKHKEVKDRRASVRQVPTVNLDELTGTIAAKRMMAKE